VGEEAKELCFGCWKDLNDFDVVEVISRSPDVPNVDVGDLGVVLLVHSNDNSVKSYEVESVLPDGRSKWLGSFQRHHLRYRIDKNHNAESDPRE